MIIELIRGNMDDMDRNLLFKENINQDKSGVGHCGDN